MSSGQMSSNHLNIVYRILFLYCFVVVFLYVRCLSADVPSNDTHPAEPSFSLRKPSSESDLEFLENTTSAHLRWRRFLIFGREDRWRGYRESVKSESKHYRRCIGPEDRRGYCQRLSWCFDEEYESSFQLAANYTCTIDRKYLGICCTEHLDRLRTNLFADKKHLTTRTPAVTVDGKQRDINETKDDDEIKFVLENSVERTEVSRGARVVGGRSTTRPIVERPRMAALFFNNGTQYCGGVFITKRYVLTAASCVYGRASRELIIRLEEYDFPTSSESGAMDLYVEEICVHKGFNVETYEHDIAIVKISSPKSNSEIRPLGLAPLSLSFENEIGTIIGRATRISGGMAYKMPMEISVQIWPQEKCVDAYARYNTETMMCTAGFGCDDRHKDSGGPLLHQMPTGRWVVAGIASSSVECDESRFSGVYTRVQPHLNWIAKNVLLGTCVAEDYYFADAEMPRIITRAELNHPVRRS